MLSAANPLGLFMNSQSLGFPSCGCFRDLDSKLVILPTKGSILTTVKLNFTRNWRELRRNPSKIRV